DEYHDLRAYAAGDSPSRIHWRKSTLEPSSWRIKHFSQHTEQPEKIHLCVDLRLPKHLANSHAAFEVLLGRAWYWLQSHIETKKVVPTNIYLILGQQSFDCSKPQGLQAAIHAITSAKPEHLPPHTQNNHILLSLVETS
ncbi:MAG: DUF58 domain-containing protein, partial [Mariprofundaceae bacterium]|nr:DUF58 domain-containing protein [Mariprofundaceae bacterium]